MNHRRAARPGHCVNALDTIPSRGTNRCGWVCELPVRRAQLTVILVLTLLFETFGAEAQQPSKLHRIGWLVSTSDSGPRATFRDAMRELGYVEGQNFVFEARSADGNTDRLPALTAELIRARVDIIVAVAPAAIRAAKQASTGVPVVMAFWGGPDLIESGIIASFARPGGNVTGVHMLQSALDPKRLELLLEVVPGAKRVGVLTHHGSSFEPVIAGIRNLAQRVGLQLHVSDVPQTDRGYEKAFESIAQARADALFVPTSPQFQRDRRVIIDLAAKRRIPAIYDAAVNAHDGGLMAYGANRQEMDRRAAALVDKILKGARPGDLPVEQPTKFELVINLATAKTLGLAIPRSLLLRADQVIR